MQNGWNVLFFIYKNQRRNHWDRQRKQAYWHTGTPAHQHTGTPAQHTGTPAHWHTSTLAHWHTHAAEHFLLVKINVGRNQFCTQKVRKIFFFVHKIYLAKKRLTLAHPHTGTPAHTPAHRHSGTLAHRHTGTLAHRHTKLIPTLCLSSI